MKKIGNIELAFEQETRSIPLDRISPAKTLPPEFNKTKEYRKILDSVKAIGLVEMPVVAIDPGNVGSYILLDGHLRIQALKDLGMSETDCLVSTDDEGYTYNKRINRLAPAQEHKMIRAVIDRGVPEAMIAKALGPEARWARARSQMLDGICPDAAEILHNQFCPQRVFRFLREMAPQRQVEAATLMVSQDNTSTVFARALLVATPPDAMVRVRRRPMASADQTKQLVRMEQELATLHAKAKSIQGTYTIDNLHLTIMRRYLITLLGNSRIFRWLDHNRSNELGALLALAERDMAYEGKRRSSKGGSDCVRGAKTVIG